MIESWQKDQEQTAEEKDNRLASFCTQCSYTFSNGEEKFCPRCATPRQGVSFARPSPSHATAPTQP